jgi:capsular exopolysaccharide synthesis family protein
MTDGSSMPSPANPAEAVEGIELREYGRLLWRRRTILLTVLAVVVVSTALFTFLATPQYQAAATLQIERHGPDVLTFRDVLNIDTAGYHDFYQTQYKILQSRAVLRIAAEQLDLPNRPEYAGRRQSPLARLVRALGARSGAAAPAGDPLEQATTFLAAGVAVRPIEKSHLVRVLFTDPDRDLAAAVANAVVEAYRQFNLDARYSTTAQASEFLTGQVSQLQEEIAEKERRLQAYRAERDLTGLGEGDTDITAQALADLSAQHVAAEGRLALAEVRHETVSATAPDSLEEVIRSPLISRLRQEYAELERRQRQTAERFGPEWPERRLLDEEVRQAAARLELERDLIASQARAAAEADVRKARAELAALAVRVEQRKSEVERIKSAAVDYANLEAEILGKRSFLNELVGRQSETVVSDRLRDTRTSNIRVVDRARAPREPVRPRKALNLGLSLVLGLMAGIGAAVLADHLDSTIKSVQDIERAGLAVLGQISLVRPLRIVAGSGPGSDPIDLGSHLDSRSGFAECFKNLRTSLLLASPDRPPRHIVVTSAEPGDGKSTVSANLAIVLAQAGRRVLLVDADLRRPRIHAILGTANDVGLSSYLTGNATFEELLRSTGIPNLKLVTSGPIPPTPSELLGSPSLDALLDRLSREFDHVIFDSAPALQVADTVILAARTDAAVLVIRIGKTCRESVNQAVSRLRRARTHVIGAVLNAVAEQAGYYYGRAPDGGVAAHAPAGTVKQQTG